MTGNDDILRMLPADFQDRIAKMPEAKRVETLARARKHFESMDDNARAQMQEGSGSRGSARRTSRRWGAWRRTLPSPSWTGRGSGCGCRRYGAAR